MIDLRVLPALSRRTADALFYACMFSQVAIIAWLFASEPNLVVVTAASTAAAAGSIAAVNAGDAAEARRRGRDV